MAPFFSCLRHRAGRGWPTWDSRWHPAAGRSFGRPACVRGDQEALPKGGPSPRKTAWGDGGRRRVGTTPIGCSWPPRAPPGRSRRWCLGALGRCGGGLGGWVRTVCVVGTPARQPPAGSGGDGLARRRRASAADARAATGGCVYVQGRGGEGWRGQGGAEVHPPWPPPAHSRGRRAAHAGAWGRAGGRAARRRHADGATARCRAGGAPGWGAAAFLRSLRGTAWPPL